MRPCRLTGRTGKPVSSMRRSRVGLVTLPPGGPGQPSAGITTGRLRWLHECEDEGAVATAPDAVRIEDAVSPGSTAQGDRKRRTWSAGRRLPSDRKEGRGRSQDVPRAGCPPGASQAPAPAGAPLPSLGSCELEFTEGLPGADQRTRAMNHAFPSFRARVECPEASATHSVHSRASRNPGWTCQIEIQHWVPTFGFRTSADSNPAQLAKASVDGSRGRTGRVSHREQPCHSGAEGESGVSIVS